MGTYHAPTASSTVTPTPAGKQSRQGFVDLSLRSPDVVSKSAYSTFAVRRSGRSSTVSHRRPPLSNVSISVLQVLLQEVTDEQRRSDALVLVEVPSHVVGEHLVQRVLVLQLVERREQSVRSDPLRVELKLPTRTGDDLRD